MLLPSSHTVSKLQRRYYEICSASHRHFFSFAALYYPLVVAYTISAVFSLYARNKLKCHQAPMLTEREREVFASDSEMSDFFLSFFFSFTRS